MKPIYQRDDYVDAIVPVGAFYDCPEIDCLKMDVASFVMTFPLLMTADIKIMGKNGTNAYQDLGIIIDPLDGAAPLGRNVRIDLNGIGKIRLRFENIVVGGQVNVGASARGL